MNIASPYIFDAVMLACFAAFLLVVTLLDVWLWSRDGWSGNWTISESIRRTNQRFPALQWMIVFGFGVLTGHWFW
jgi:hypothetical protein